MNLSQPDNLNPKERTMQTLTTSEAAQRLNVDPSRVRVLCRTGRLGRKFGHIWMITDDDVAAYLKAGPKPAGRPQKG